jgi:carbon-monoxide dehydrogenase medium subunit
MSRTQLPEFELLIPKSLREAVEYLEEHGGHIAVMAGGTDLLIQMKEDYRPKFVMTLGEIPDLDFVTYDPQEGLRIGAMATIAAVLERKDVKEKYRALWQSAAQNGTPQTRNSATVLGNLLRASPAGDCCCAILAHGGCVVLEGPSGRRDIDIDTFWKDYRVTARRENELAVEVRLPPQDGETRSAFSALNRTSQDLAKINAAVSLKMKGKICLEPRIAMGAVAPTPLRLIRSEKHLKGSEITEDVLRRTVESASKEITPIDDIRSTAEYRRQVTIPLLRRTIQAAIK